MQHQKISTLSITSPKLAISSPTDAARVASLKSPKEAESWKREIDLLFQKHSIPELRTIEKRTRDDLELKKQELRVLVGERYHDLINAADTIMDMRTPANLIVANMKSLIHELDPVKISSAVDLKCSTWTLQTTSKDVFTVGSMSKLLDNASEQIWSSLENDQYLGAALLFLISKDLCSLLQRDFSKASELKITQATIARQWSSIEHFCEKILSQVRQFTCHSDISDQSLTEAMCAIALLSRKTTRDILEDFLNCRQELIRSLFKPNSMNCLLDSVRAFKSTLFHSVAIFRQQTSDSPSLIDTVLESVRSGKCSNLQGIENQPDKPIVVRLFGSSKTNVMLLQHYLPDSIRKFVPQFLDSTKSHVDLNKLIKQWTDVVSMDIQRGCGVALEGITSETVLGNCRTILWDELISDERDSRGQNKSLANTSWTELCHAVFAKPVFVWDLAYRRSFHEKSLSILQMSLKSFKEKIVNHVRKRLLEFDSVDDLDSHPDFDICRNLWNTSASRSDVLFMSSGAKALSPNSQSNFLETNVNQVSPSIGAGLDFFDVELAAIRDDCKALQVNLDSGNTGTDLFFASHDFDLVWAEFVTTCLSTLSSIAEHFRKATQDCFQSALPGLAANRVSLAKSVFVARLFRSLLNSVVLRSALVTKADMDEVSHIFDGLYKKCFDFWIQIAGSEFSKKCSDYLESVDHWDSISMSIARQSKHTSKGSVRGATGGTWEFHQIQIKNEKGEEVSDQILVPAHPSLPLYKIILDLCREINRQGGYSLDRDLIVAPLITACLDNWLTFMELYVAALPTKKVDYFLEERTMFQLLFDMQFVWIIFYSPSFKDSEARYKRYLALKNSLRQLLDPVELSLSEQSIQSKVEKSYGRYRLMFDFICQMNGTDMARKSTSGTSSFAQEQHNIVAIMTPPQRFVLLPVNPISANEAAHAEGAKKTKENDAKRSQQCLSILANSAAGGKVEQTVKTARPSLKQKAGSVVDSSSLSTISSSIQSKLGFIGLNFS